jgi:hypothetical protein
MIAAVKGCHAVLSALLFLILPAADAADDLSGAARELARKTAGFAKVEPQAVSWRNVSALSPAEMAQARAAFEAALQESGGRASGLSPISIRITLSQNPTQYLLIEEAQSGDDRQVWIATWKRSGAARHAAPGMSLQSKLILEQDEPILDVAFLSDAMLVLSPSKVMWRGQAAAMPAKSWPRDLRGHLRVTADTFQAFLPGTTCTGSSAPLLHMDCRTTDEPWVLESASRAILLANFAATRNYFDGRMVTQSGLRKTVTPFFSVAAVEEQGRTSWLLAAIDGRTQIFDSAFDPQGSFTSWGSDLAAIDSHCGATSQIIATRPGDGSEPDAVQAFALVNGAPVPVTAPVTFAGPVTALWPSGASAALVVARDLSTGKYGAYVITVACGS